MAVYFVKADIVASIYFLQRLPPQRPVETLDLSIKERSLYLLLVLEPIPELILQFFQLLQCLGGHQRPVRGEGGRRLGHC